MFFSSFLLHRLPSIVTPLFPRKDLFMMLFLALSFNHYFEDISLNQFLNFLSTFLFAVFPLLLLYCFHKHLRILHSRDLFITLFLTLFSNTYWKHVSSFFSNSFPQFSFYLSIIYLLLLQCFQKKICLLRRSLLFPLISIQMNLQIFFRFMVFPL